MKTKLVTAYYPHSVGHPIWGKLNRERWYKHSLKSIANTGVPIVCYTSGSAQIEMQEYKELHNLSNIELINYDITQGPFHERIVASRLANPEKYNNPEHFFYHMPVSIYWNKWEFLRLQYEEDAYVYWIDAGLSTDGLFPHRFNDFYHEIDNLSNWNGLDEHKHHGYANNVFNPQLIDRINQFTSDKILNLCRAGQTDNDFYLMQDKINEPVQPSIYQDNKFPVASLFGGKGPLLLEYIEKTHAAMDKVLLCGDYVCTEQEIMGYVHTFNKEMFSDWCFNDFYHEDWKFNIYDEIKTYKELFPNNTSFWQFWINEEPAP